jgi:transketolase
MMNVQLLQEKANAVRIGIIESTHAAKSGHPGGSLSCTELITYLYFHRMNVDPLNPKWEDRDRFVLSKGHCAPALYAALAHRGFFDPSRLTELRKLGSFLQGHPDMKTTPGVDMSTGSLGQGISAACGMAMTAKATNKNWRVYTLLGDGECEEGQVWEAAMFASHYKLDNLIAFVDFNGYQIDGAVTDVMNPTPIDEKFASFGWHTLVIDGHDFEAIDAAVEEALKIKDKPCAVIMKTVKGKGVSFMENNYKWHGVATNDEQKELALNELKGANA